MTPQQADIARTVLSSEIARSRTNATALSLEIGRGKDYLRDFLRGRKESLGAGDLLKIEKVLGVPRARLLGEVRMEEVQRVPLGQEFGPDPIFTDDPEGYAAAERLEKGRLAPGEVVERNVIGGLGSGGKADEINIDGMVLDGVRAVWRLPVEYLRAELRAREAEVDFIAVDGDSMMPTLMPGDRVLINRSQTAPSPDGLYAIFDGVGISIKRLEIIKGSSPVRLRIISDNPKHGTDEIFADDLNVIGRVICRVSRV